VCRENGYPGHSCPNRKSNGLLENLQKHRSKAVIFDAKLHTSISNKQRSRSTSARCARVQKNGEDCCARVQALEQMSCVRAA
jgi:hypothetical protein